jgi:hypothetical protein
MAALAGAANFYTVEADDILYPQEDAVAQA